MCPIESPVLILRPSSCFREANLTKGLKRRHNDEQSQPTRPAKRRVSFSSHVDVHTATEDYDRTSIEMTRPLPRRQRVSSKKVENVLATPTTPAPVEEDGAKSNFCGRWKRSHGFKWAALLELSGVDKADVSRQIARMQASSVMHLIEHDDVSFHLVVHSHSGKTQDQHFFIGGQPRPTSDPTIDNGSLTILANMRWASNGKVLVLTNVDPATGDEMTVSRRLGSKGGLMVQHYKARCARSGQTAEAVTIFRKVVLPSDTLTS